MVHQCPLFFQILYQVPYEGETSLWEVVVKQVYTYFRVDMRDLRRGELCDRSELRLKLRCIV